MPITVNELKKLYIAEKDSKQLESVDDDLYESIGVLLRNLEEKVEEGSNQKEQDVDFILKQVRNYSKKLIKRRRKKILKSLFTEILDNSGAEISFNMSYLTPEEQKLCDSIIKSAEEFNIKTFGKILDLNIDKDDKEVEEEDESFEDLKYVIATVKENKLEFKDKRGRNWGPLPEETVICAPEEVLKELEEDNKVEVANIE